MNLINVNDQLANIAQICRKTPTVTLRRAYTRALREFLQQTQWLRLNVPGLLVQNQRQYAIGNDPHFDVIGIFAMRGQRTDPNQKPQFWPIVPSDSSQWDPNNNPGQPCRFQYIGEAQFAVDPIPQQDYDLQVTLILQSKEGATMVPEAPLLKYSNEVEAGALAYLLGIPGQPWSNPAMAAAKDREFRSGISNGKAEVQRNFNVGSQRARPRQFIL